jgi:nitrogenase molybdenum-iron protein alpha/beta subunit
MKQVAGLISTYSSDEFGICSALYELGGMVVMHDASGCNSTYTTHDEPRWYDMDSMIYISAISEMEAIMGDDDKFIADLVETANELQPKFIAVVGAPIPYMIGTDLHAIAALTSQQTGIPAFGLDANGMHNYVRGVSWL